MFSKHRLPHYFFGDDMDQDNKIAKNTIVDEFHSSEPNISRIPSPTSSVASNKKLEWDSGADIGYNVYNSLKNRRSKSFPSLNMDLSISQINKSDETQTDEVSIENKVTDDVKQNKNFPCSSQNNFKHSTPNEEKIMFSKIFKTGNENKDECLQTTLVHISSKSVQTDDRKINKSQQTDNFKKSCYSSSNNSSSKTSSFQYIPGSNYVSRATSENSECRSTSKTSENKSENSNISSPLGKIISRQQSKHLIADIDKSLSILQNFIKSKNYNADTKKHYAKKIISKIVASKYSDDSTSISSSSFSTAKSENKISKISCGVQCDPNEKCKENYKNAATSPMKIKNMENLTKHTIKYECKNRPELYLNIKNWKEGETLSEKLFEARRKSSQSTSHCSFEDLNKNSSKKSGDYLLEHSKSERKRQLSWINNEISYLHKLKDLLQNKDFSSNNSLKSSNEFSDIETKFYQQFGLNPPKNLTKLSKYLNNDQIKLLIEKDAKQLRHETCECCKQKQNKDEMTSEIYNSHNYDFYESLINTCPYAKNNETVAKKSDAGIQCTLRKKKRTIIETNSPPTDRSDKNVQLFYENVSNFDRSDSQSTEYEKIHVDLKKCPNLGKENKNYQRPAKYPTRQTEMSQPVAYFLTFEEESPSEMSLSTMRRKSLENVTVKIPKFNRFIYKNSGKVTEKNKTSYTLQDYLQINRPGFVKSADWRRSIVSDQSERKSRNIFTCSQMKEITSRQYNKLPEVQNKIKTFKDLSTKRHNRCMANVFSKKLQKKTLKGQMSIATCINVMSSSE